MHSQTRYIDEQPSTDTPRTTGETPDRCQHCGHYQPRIDRGNDPSLALTVLVLAGLAAYEAFVYARKVILR